MKLKYFLFLTVLFLLATQAKAHSCPVGCGFLSNRGVLMASCGNNKQDALFNALDKCRLQMTKIIRKFVPASLMSDRQTALRAMEMCNVKAYSSDEGFALFCQNYRSEEELLREWIGHTCQRYGLSSRAGELSASVRACNEEEIERLMPQRQ